MDSEAAAHEASRVASTAVDIAGKVAWPVVVLVCFFFFFLLFRKQVSELLRRLIFRIKRGDTELEMGQSPAAAAEEAKGPTEEQATGEEAAPDDSAKTVCEGSDTGKRTSGELFGAMVNAAKAGNLAEAQEAFEELQKAETDPLKRPLNEACYRYFRYRGGDSGAMDRLREMAQQSGTASIAHYWIASCYQTAGDYAEAAQEYRESAKEAENEEKRAESLVAAALALLAGGKGPKATALLGEVLVSAKDSKAICVLYSGLAELHKKLGNAELRALALEKALEANPNSRKLRFGAGYAYAEAELEALALLHYRTLLRFQPNDKDALNNLAIAYKKLEMPIHAARSYEEAYKLGNTLAAANLSYTLMNVGLGRQATELLEEARRKDRVHPSVGSALSALAEKKEEENKTLERTIEKAGNHQRFLRSYADARLLPNADRLSFDGTWRSGPGVEVQINQSGRAIEGHWAVRKGEYKLTGLVKQRTAEIEVLKKHRLLHGMEGSFVDDGKGRACISPDGDGLFIMIYGDEEQEAKFMELRRS